MAQQEPKANWQPTIVKKEIAPRSYLIIDNNDRVLRQNRSHLIRMEVPESTSTNSETRSTSTSGTTDPNSSQLEAQSKRQTTSRRRQVTRPSEQDLLPCDMEEQ